MTDPLWPYLAALRDEANGYAAMYGGPVYLVGGALREKWPNDVDIRVVVSPDDWARLFGQKMGPDEPAADGTSWKAEHWRRAREGLKQSRRLSRRFGYRIDFQIQHDAEASRYADRPRFRLDRAPDDFFDAGKADA